MITRVDKIAALKREIALQKKRLSEAHRTETNVSGESRPGNCSHGGYPSRLHWAKNRP